MKKVWLSAIALCVAVLLMVRSAHAETINGSYLWGYDWITTPQDNFASYMAGYSSNAFPPTHGYADQVYGGGGPILANQWQTLSYTLNNIHSESPTITVSVQGAASTTSAYGGPVVVPTDMWVAFGQGVNGNEPFEQPIYVRDFEVKLNGTTVATEQLNYPNGTNLLDGTHAGWSDPGGAAGVPFYVETAPGGYQAGEITSAHGFVYPWTVPDWAFPAITQDQFNAANSITFSLQAYYPSLGTPEPSSFVLLGLAGVGLVGYVKRRKQA